MRGFLPILRTTALEILSEPLTLLVALAALSMSVLAPTFHYHQFGEATRMARDAGFSAAFLGACVLAVFGTIRAVRREIESGTLEMALARPVSRKAFFLAKAAGAYCAALAVFGTVFATSLVVVEGAAVGGRLAERSGDLARLWGPCVAAGVAVIVLPLAVSAALNRFARFRFVLTAVVLAAGLSAAFGIWATWRDFGLLAPYFAGAMPLALLTAVWTSAAAAFAFLFKSNAAAALAGLVVAGSLPFVGNYYLADALANGGSVTWTHVGLSALAAAPAVAAFLLLGCRAGEGGFHREG